jgi:hypothetical protein
MRYRHEYCLVSIVALFWCNGCSQQPSKLYTLPSGKQIKITNVGSMHFSGGGPALVMSCETDINIDDMTALRAEANEIWDKFQLDVEKAGMKNAVIRMVHREGTGILTSSSGYGFVFEKRADGQWHCLEDDKK